MKKKCYNCNEKGHIKTRCPKLKDRRQVQEINTNCVSVNSIDIQKYIKVITLNNVLFTAMIDAGSAVCCITENAAKRSNLN